MSFLYGILLVTKQIITIPPYLQTPDDPNVITLLITTGLIGLIGVILMIIANTIPSYQYHIWIIGCLLYIVAFGTMFFFGRLLRKPNNPTKPLSGWHIAIGVFAAFIPFLLFIVAGNQIFQEVLITDEDTLFMPFMKIMILGIPAVAGIYGSGIFGKMSP